MIEKKVYNQNFCQSPYNTTDRIQFYNQKKKQYNIKQKTNSAVDDVQNNQSNSNHNDDDHQKQMKFEIENQKKYPKIQEIKTFTENLVQKKVIDQDVYLNALNMNIKRQSLIQIQEVSKLLTESKVQNGSNKTHRIRKLNNLPVQNQELQSRDEEEKNDSSINQNQQINNYSMQALGLQIPQKAEELQKLKTNIAELQKQKQQIQKFLRVADSKLEQNPLLFKKYLYRNNSFDARIQQQVNQENNQKPQAIEQNLIVKINKINQIHQEVHRLSALNKTLLEDNHILKNQIDKNEQQILNFEKHAIENENCIQQLQNDLQNLQFVQQKENIEKVNQELLNKDKEIEQLRFQINQEIEQKNNNQQIYNQEIEQLNAILNEKKQDNDQLNNNLRHLNTQIQELKQQNEDYNNKNLEYNQIINNLKLEINNIQANLDIKDQNIYQLTQNIEQLNLEIQQLNKDKESLIQDKEQLNENIQSLNQNINQLNQDKEQLNKDKELLNENIQSLNKKIQQLNKDKEQLNENIQKLIQHQEQLNQEIIQKDDNIQDLKIELQIYEYSSKKIFINVANQNQKFEFQLKDSINDIYMLAAQQGFQIQLNRNTTLFVPSKNKRILQSNWNQKLYQIFVPDDYNQPITIEFSN
ncbi:unnamed protein product [Paramecium primaurelia]|uniref:Uncharacterized protein n=1 Tax=Paramecium primaurelia TaxID=5886 RepID=A0A8S1M7Q0_PARPR|nr:unnamed protein product [Paramecium primaurelia]